jgi:hypothetical protein
MAEQQRYRAIGTSGVEPIGCIGRAEVAAGGVASQVALYIAGVFLWKDAYDFLNQLRLCLSHSL